MKRAGERLRFQLPAHGEKGRAREKILRVIDFPVRAPRRILRIDRGDAKQFPRAFAIAPGDDRRVDVNKAALLEKLMDGEREPAADAKDRAEQIRARPQMRDLAQKLRRVPFLLQRIGVVRRADDFDFVRHDFPALAFALRRHQRAAHRDRSARDQMLDRRVIRQRVLRDDLKIAQAGAIVQLDERKIFRIAPRPHPALDLNARDRRGTLQGGFDGSGSWHPGSLPGDAASTSKRSKFSGFAIARISA